MLKSMQQLISIALLAGFALTGCAGGTLGEEATSQGPIVNTDWPNLVDSCVGQSADDSYYDFDIQKEGSELVVVANGLGANPFLKCLGDTLANGAPSEDLGSFMLYSALSEGEWDEEGELGIHRIEYGDLSVSANRTSENTYVLRFTITP
jgi:hypothetical protein